MIFREEALAELGALSWARIISLWFFARKIAPFWGPYSRTLKKEQSYEQKSEWDNSGPGEGSQFR